MTSSTEAVARVHHQLLFMQRMIFLLGLLLFITLSENVEAQRGFAADTLEDLIIYSNERSGVVVAHSRGLGIGYRAGKNVNAFRTRSIAVELVSINSGKQIKTINPYYANSKRYTYGKLNDVLLLRAGMSNKMLLNRKPYWGGVEVRFIYEGGLSLGLMKPYYLFVIKINQLPFGGLDYVIETQRFNADSYSWDDIYGRAPFTKGLNEIKLVPGAYAKVGFNFEFGAVKTTTRAFEAGVITDFFPQNLAIMDDARNQKLFLNFYISYAFGKRFNKY